ncbi:MAG: hypothetical protein AAGD40_06570, partial [Pseudomonadota bacterium]
MTRPFLIAAAAGFALTICPCVAGAVQAQDLPPPDEAEIDATPVIAAPAETPAPVMEAPVMEAPVMEAEVTPVSTSPTDSGVLVSPQKRIPLDQFRVPRACDSTDPEEICVVAEDPIEEDVVTTPDPGDRLLDVGAERSALAGLGSNGPDDCSLVGAIGASGCSYKT